MVSQLGSKIRSLFSHPTGIGATVLSFGGQVVVTSIVVTGLLVGARQLGLLQGLELGAFDQLIRLRPEEGPDNRLLVVGITEEDIQTRKEYPLHDGTLATLLKKIQQSQPRAIGLDILRDVPQGEGRDALIKQLKENENLIAVCKLSSADQPGIAAVGVPEERVGFADLPLDPGGTLRRSLLLSPPTAFKLPVPEEHLCNIPDPENQLFSLDLQLALLYLEPQNIAPELTPAGEMKIGPTVFKRLGAKAGGYHNADVGNYQIMMNYRSAKKSTEIVSLTEVLAGKINPALIKDRVVLIGYTASIVKDDFYTPYSAGQQDNQKMPGVVVHAQNVSQILSAVIDNRPLIWFWSEWNEILWIWGWSLVGGTIAWKFRQPWRFGFVGVAAMGVLFGACYALFIRAGWIPIVPPVLALLATAGGVILIDRYAKAIYQGVKGFLKIDIQIDQEKKEREVAEIVETDYFQDLQEKGKLLKKRDGSATQENASEYTEPRRVRRATPTGESTEELDYFQMVQLRMQQRQAQENGQPLDGDSSADNGESADADYFNQLQQRARKLKHKDEQ